MMMKKPSLKLTTILFASLTMFVLISTMVASFSWFLIVHPSTSLDTVSGDMSITLNRLSALRYVYPFYSSSNSFIDYSKEGKIKEYVLNDSSCEFKENITVTNNSSVTLSNPYYLVGNDVFLGETTSNQFDVSSAFILTSSADSKSYRAENVTLSSGSQFVIIDNKLNIQGFASLTLLDGILYENNSFRVTKACLVNLELSIDDSSNITFKFEKVSRSDDAILSMTLFDPTLAKLNGQETNLKEAIYDQNTCLIYKIDLKIKSQTHDFLLNMDVKRSALDNENGMTSRDKEYVLSHFLTFRVATSIGGLTPYNYFHQDREKYLDGAKSFSEYTDTSLNLYSAEVTNQNTEKDFSIYVAVDYNPKQMSDFFTESNLGLTFNMIRDFTFYFSCKQIVHETLTNESSSSNGESI